MNLVMTSFHHLLLHIMLVLIISSIQFPLACHGCDEQERRALLDFKLSLDDDPSDRLFSWQEGIQHKNCCNWHGIQCSHDHVISINLRNTDLEIYYHEDKILDDMPTPKTALEGKILSPSSLSNITHLEYLDLGFNNFHESQIPDHFFSHLTELVHLDFSYSNLSGSISTQLANLTSLQYLDLSCIGSSFYYFTSCLELSSSTKWVTGLEELQVLRLSGIDLYDEAAPFPEQLVNLTSLSILDLSNCKLQGSGVPHLWELKELDVSDNWNFHPDLARLFQNEWPELQRLSISRTLVNESIPFSISNALQLVSVSASSCSIQGSLPSSIYNLSRLQTLDVSYNNITSYIHSSVSNLKLLNILDLSRNHFQGTIPISICEIFSLQRLDFRSNSLTGSIPSCITNFKNLFHFSVQGNSIEGNVSLISFINEMRLTYLDLSANSPRLTVVVDQHFHLYSKFKLQYLNLKSCNMKGLFPTFICKLNDLRYLDLSHNNLTGVIPSNCISKLKNLNRIDMSFNKIRGPLPLPPEQAPGSKIFPVLDLSNNELSGEISTECGKRLSKFYSINLVGNKLSGSIPFSICSNNSIPVYIDFSSNNLSGVIPTSIGYCKNLNVLNLGSNNLIGNVPHELGKVQSLRYLQLNDNNLNGTILNFISNIEYLQVLNLANNHFEGSIPTAFGSLHNLWILSLRSNKFSGSIPEEIYHLDQLQMVDLSVNCFSGEISAEIRGLVFLRTRPTGAVVLNDYSANLQVQMVIKGVLTQFGKLNNYNSGIDLSSNNLEGNIPEEICLLQGLSTLNLSHNFLSGVIPQSVGSMVGLGALDFSFNKLSGHIPESLVSIDSLGYLNLSHNNLSGKIPREPHFDTLSGDGSAYANNSLLCSYLTNITCTNDERSDASPTEIDGEDDPENAKDKLLLYVIVALGYGVGIWGLFLVLLVKKEKWWLGYWRLVDVVAVGVVGNFVRTRRMENTEKELSYF